jgi:hypothetical protein
MMHPERSPFACFGPINALFGNDPNFLSGPTFRPHTPKVPPLDKPVPWRDDGAGLYPPGAVAGAGVRLCLSPS